MQRLEVSGAVWPIYRSLGFKGLSCFDCGDLFPSLKFIVIIFEIIFFVLDLILCSMIIMELKL
jgi:hypothetical protein